MYNMQQSCVSMLDPYTYFAHNCMSASTGGVIGLTLIPLLADALGGEAAFIISGAVGVGWAVLGAAVINTNNAAAAGNKHGRVTTKQQQQQQRRHELGIEHKPQPHQQGSDQQQQHQEEAQVPWGLSRRSWQQVAVLCYAHATIGFGFFLMQVGVRLISARYVTHIVSCMPRTWHML